MRTFIETQLDPALNAPVVAYLAHASCPLNGEVLGCQGGRITRLFVAETDGVTDKALTIEAVRDHLLTITNERGYHVFADGEASAAYAKEALASRVAQPLEDHR